MHFSAFFYFYFVFFFSLGFELSTSVTIHSFCCAIGLLPGFLLCFFSLFFFISYLVFFFCLFSRWRVTTPFHSFFLFFGGGGFDISFGINPTFGTRPLESMASSCELAESGGMWLLRQTTEVSLCQSHFGVISSQVQIVSGHLSLDSVSRIGTSTQSLKSMAFPCECAEDSGMWLVWTTVEVSLSIIFWFHELTMQLFSENRDLESVGLLL